MAIRKNGYGSIGHFLIGVACASMLVGCGTDGDVGVVEKLRYDFGIGEKPEGYVTPVDRILERLDTVAKTEMKRMNTGVRHGEIKFQDDQGLQGKFYKEAKRFESYLVLDARTASRGSQNDRGYVGFIEYTYQVYQSERTNTRAEAEAKSASISTPERGREVYRYTFGPGGTWDGAPGELSQL